MRPEIDDKLVEKVVAKFRKGQYLPVEVTTTAIIEGILREWLNSGAGDEK
jgi:hypothetical protein